MKLVEWIKCRMSGCIVQSGAWIRGWIEIGAWVWEHLYQLDGCWLLREAIKTILSFISYTFGSQMVDL